MFVRLLNSVRGSCHNTIDEATCPDLQYSRYHFNPCVSLELIYLVAVPTPLWRVREGVMEVARHPVTLLLPECMWNTYDQRLELAEGAYEKEGLIHSRQ